MGAAQSFHARDSGAGVSKKNKTQGATGQLIQFDAQIDPRYGLALLMLLPIAIGGVRKLFANDTNELIRCRKEAYNRKAREDITSKLKTIEAKAHERSLHDTLHPSRPFGLAGDMEGFRRHVWDLVFVHVNDLDTIESLREVCTMFRDLLQRKYVAAGLPKIISQCLELKVIPWKYGSRAEMSDWMKTLSSLRTLSKATKRAVDNLFDRGLLAEGDWFRVQWPHFEVQYWKIPNLRMGALDVELTRLQRILDTKDRHIPVKTMTLNGNLPFDLDHENLRNAFQRCVEKIGANITSFNHYTTNESHLNVYRNLRRLVAHLANLEELIVQCEMPAASPYCKKVDPFPSCPNLKRYLEGKDGFGYPYINEIFKANPTIEEVLLGRTPSLNLEVKNLLKVLDTLPLKTFNCLCMPTIEFLEYRFSWAQQLTILSLWDTANAASPVIPSMTMFAFISNFRDLKILGIMSSRVRDTGGNLNLPKLETLYWEIVPGFKSLEFMKPLESLDWLAFDISTCPGQFKEMRNVMEFLKKWHIPELFPRLKVIELRTERNGSYKKIWKR